MEAKLRARGLKSRIHRKGKRGKPLTEQGKASNRTKSAVRARVEHVFGAQTNDMGGTLVRVRRQNIWRRSGRNLAESGPHLWVDVMRRACGAASADVRWSFV
nr:transposase [uncultured bacterium]|tara:strand:- start:1470 stop:1775 length:306 start_codon:yes stop_codon:yes gene_type:complete